MRFRDWCLNAWRTSQRAPGWVWSTMKRRKVREELEEGDERAERMKKRVVFSQKLAFVQVR